MNKSVLPTTAKRRCLLLYRSSQDGDECVRLLMMKWGRVWGSWIPGINLEAQVKREVVEFFSVQQGEGDTLRSHQIGIPVVFSCTKLSSFAYSLLHPSLLGSNSRNKRAALQLYPVNTLQELPAVFLINQNIKMHVMTISEILIAHTIFFHCESNFLNL